VEGKSSDGASDRRVTADPLLMTKREKEKLAATVLKSREDMASAIALENLVEGLC
jgi:hypothetical protein